MAKAILVGSMVVYCLFISSQAIQEYSMGSFEDYFESDWKYGGYPNPKQLENNLPVRDDNSGQYLSDNESDSESDDEYEDEDENKNNYLQGIDYSDDEYFQDSYAQINDLLKSDDNEVNMNYVKELVKDGIPDEIEIREPEEEGQEDRLFDALEQVSKLETTQGCGWESYKTNAINHVATNGDPEENYIKIKKLVSYYNLKLARQCPSELMEKSRIYYDKIDSKSKRRVEIFTDAFIDKNIPKNSNGGIDRLNFIENYARCSFMLGAERITYDKMKELDEDGELINLKATKEVSKGIFKKKKKIITTFDIYRYFYLMKKYITLPCEEFRNVLGPNTFIPAYFYAYLQIRGKEFDANSYDEQFYRLWARYRVCDCFATKTYTPGFMNDVGTIASRYA